MEDILPFTKKAKVRIYNPFDEDDYKDIDMNVPKPNFMEDTIDRSTEWGDDKILEFENGDKRIEVNVSVYNSIGGGDVVVSCDECDDVRYVILSAD